MTMVNHFRILTNLLDFFDSKGCYGGSCWSFWIGVSDWTVKLLLLTVGEARNLLRTSDVIILYSILYVCLFCANFFDGSCSIPLDIEAIVSDLLANLLTTNRFECLFKTNTFETPRLLESIKEKEMSIVSTIKFRSSWINLKPPRCQVWRVKICQL